MNGGRAAGAEHDSAVVLRTQLAIHHSAPTQPTPTRMISTHPTWSSTGSRGTRNSQISQQLVTAKERTMHLMAQQMALAHREHLHSQAECERRARAIRRVRRAERELAAARARLSAANEAAAQAARRAEIIK